MTSNDIPTCGFRAERLRWRWTLGGFTLVEMLVVITIVLIALTMVLPSAHKIWEERKVAEAENLIQGLLMTTRARSLRDDGVESGLFFFIDSKGTQRIQSIKRDSEGELACQEPCQNLLGNARARCFTSCQVAWGNVFVVTSDRQQSLPEPMRVVPRYVVDSSDLDFEEFDEVELANNFFEELPDDEDQAQRHRNFFTMVYSSDGTLLIWRDVLIRDDDVDQDTLGDITGLAVGYDLDEDKANVTQYYKRSGAPADIDSTGHVPPQAVPFLIVDPEDLDDPIAVNFASVDGLIAYDDARFNNFDTDKQKREYLLLQGQPYYVNRLTGAVIKGPTGEVQP